MEFWCADCGCLIDRGVRVIPCASSDCCCLELPVAEPMAVIAARIRTSFNASDLDAFGSLLAENVSSGEASDSAQVCQNRNEIISTYQGLLDQGIHARVVETSTGERGVACLMEIDWPDRLRDREPTFYRVFLVTDGLVTQIERHDTKQRALAALSA